MNVTNGEKEQRVMYRKVTILLHVMHLSMLCPTSHTWGRGGERTGRCSPNFCPRGRELLIVLAILNLLTFVPDHVAEI